MRHQPAILLTVLLLLTAATPAAGVTQSTQAPNNELQSISLIHGDDPDNDGYTTLTALTVRADTTLDDTDSFGNDPGEPYLEIEINGNDVHQTEILPNQEDYTKRLTIPPTAFSNLERGTHSLTVKLGDVDGNIDDSDYGNDDLIDKWSTTFAYEPRASLDLRATRTRTVVGSPVTIGIPKNFDAEPDWTLTNAPTESTATIRGTYDGVATLKPDTKGTYTVEVRANGQRATIQITATSNNRYQTLQTYAPYIELAAGEQYRPTRYEAFIQHASLQNFGDENIETPTPFDLTGRDADWELDLRGSSSNFPTYQAEYPPTVYGSVHTDVSFRGTQYDKAVTYWLFYVYDPKHTGEIESLVAHQSDLESVTILIEDGEPRWVGASQHYGGERREWTKTPHQGTHLRIYPAKGAHSNYLRDTTNFQGSGLLGQSQFIQAGGTATVISDSVYTDRTGGGQLLTHAGKGTNYELVTLTGREFLADYRGAFGPNDGHGRPPMFRERWKHPGRWIEEGILPDEEQLALETTSRITTTQDTVTGNVEVRNVGPKPTRVWARLQVKPDTASWSSPRVRTLAKASAPVGTETTRTLELSADKYTANQGSYDARLLVSSYPPTVAEREDIELNRTLSDAYSVGSRTTEATTEPTETRHPTTTVPSEPTTELTDQTSTAASNTSAPANQIGANETKGDVASGFTTGITAITVLIVAVLLGRFRA